MPDFDFDELNFLAADLGEVPEKMAQLIPKALEVTAHHIKDDWRRDAIKQNPESSQYYPFAIDYDLDKNTVFGSDVYRAEIGPKLGGQGSLGILEDASGGVRGAPQRSGAKAAKKNEADFIKGLTKAGEDALK